MSCLQIARKLVIEKANFEVIDGVLENPAVPGYCQELETYFAEGEPYWQVCSLGRTQQPTPTRPRKVVQPKKLDNPETLPSERVEPITRSMSRESK